MYMKPFPFFFRAKENDKRRKIISQNKGRSLEVIKEMECFYRNEITGISRTPTLEELWVCGFKR